MRRRTTCPRDTASTAASLCPRTCPRRRPFGFGRRTRTRPGTSCTCRSRSERCRRNSSRTCSRQEKIDIGRRDSRGSRSGLVPIDLRETVRQAGSMEDVRAGGGKRAKKSARTPTYISQLSKARTRSDLEALDTVRHSSRHSLPGPPRLGTCPRSSRRSCSEHCSLGTSQPRTNRSWCSPPLRFCTCPRRTRCSLSDPPRLGTCPRGSRCSSFGPRRFDIARPRS